MEKKSTSNLRRRALKLLQTEPFLVLSTADIRARPHTATLFFVIDPDFTIYIVTHEESLKAVQLMKNRWASGVMWEIGNAYVQWQGVASIETHPKRIDNIMKRIMVKAQTVENLWPPIFGLPGQDYTVFRFKPTWMRAMDLSNMAIKSKVIPSVDLVKRKNGI